MDLPSRREKEREREVRLGEIRNGNGERGMLAEIGVHGRELEDNAESGEERESKRREIGL